MCVKGLFQSNIPIAGNGEKMVVKRQLNQVHFHMFFTMNFTTYFHYIIHFNEQLQAQDLTSTIQQLIVATSAL